MGFLHLPNELIYVIVSNLRYKSDIIAFVQTVRRFYLLLQTYFYQHTTRHSASSALKWTSRHGDASTVHMMLEGAALDCATDT